MADLAQKHRDFISALQEERNKIQMFSRELPLCLQLVSEAIDNLKQKAPIGEISGDKSGIETGGDNCKKDWLRSAQLWSPDGDYVGTLRKPVAVNVRRVGKAFQPFERKSKVGCSVAAAPSVSSSSGGRREGDECVEKGADEGRVSGNLESGRKQRRCWSPALHRNFLNALDQLGGSNAATPKQIRELMMVDGLTNDEVKSHLQKYRLHVRRPVVAVQDGNGSNGSQNQPQFVLVGSIWVPPQEYAATAAAAQPGEGSSTALNVMYSPLVSLPTEYESEEEKPNKKQKTNKPLVTSLHSEQRCSQDDESLVDDGATISNSSSTSFVSQNTSVPSPL